MEWLPKLYALEVVPMVPMAVAVPVAVAMPIVAATVGEGRELPALGLPFQQNL